MILSFRTFSFIAEGPFQSDALLVPEGCLFDHIHNASRCWPFIRWNQTGAAACQERGMQMRSFAMLLPCGISLFSGVEFVCCPKHFKGMFRSLYISPFIRRNSIISTTAVTMATIKCRKMMMVTGYPKRCKRCGMIAKQP